MITRFDTKFGMATSHPTGDHTFRKVIFDKAVALNGHMKTKEWLIRNDRIDEIRTGKQAGVVK